MIRYWDSLKLPYMFASQRGSARIIWGLLVIWLCFGGVALAEQVSLIMETSDQDETALALLAFSLKPAVPDPDLPYATDAVNPVVAVSLLSLPSASLSESPWRPPQAAALRSHQRLSVYRI